jgi:hypothetical protein
MTPAAWSLPNPYVARTLLRIDALIYRLEGRRLTWRGGMLCEQMPAGHGVELRTHFPDWAFHYAAKLQNRWFWTRRLLSL